MSPLLLATLLLMVDDDALPQPAARWSIAYLPEFALLESSGASMLFLNDQVYRYDAEGNLLGDYSLTFAPKAVFLGPNDTVWVHDGENLLAKLNENFNPQWQRDMPPPAGQPQAYESWLVYAAEDRVQLLDPEDGSAQFTWLHTAPIATLIVYRSRVLVSDANGEVHDWDPSSGRKGQLFVKEGGGQERQLEFVSPGPEGALSLAYSNGLLRVLRASQRHKWRRDFRIRIPVAPVWLQADGQRQLTVATDGRNGFAFGEQGQQIARALFSGRPRALIKWSDHLALIVPGLVKQLIWYRADQRRFIAQPMESRQNLTAVAGAYVMLIDNDGTIRLYQRDVSDARKDAK